MAAWKEKKVAEHKLREKKETQKKERLRGPCSCRKNGGYGGRGGENQKYFHIAQNIEAENDNVKVCEMQVISDRASDDDDDFNDLGSGNGNGSK